MITTKCVIRLPSHTAHITISDDDTIQVFKYSTRACDFDVFTVKDSFSASDFIVEPLPSCYYAVTFPGEDVE